MHVVTVLLSLFGLHLWVTCPFSLCPATPSGTQGNQSSQAPYPDPTLKLAALSPASFPHAQAAPAAPACPALSLPTLPSWPTLPTVPTAHPGVCTSPAPSLPLCPLPLSWVPAGGSPQPAGGANSWLWPAQLPHKCCLHPPLPSLPPPVTETALAGPLTIGVWSPTCPIPSAFHAPPPTFLPFVA